MNILVVCHYGLYQNLTSSFVHNQAKTYAALGHRVRVIVPVPLGKSFRGKRIGPAYCVSQVDGVSLHYVRYLSASNYGNKGFNVKSASCAIRGRLKAILKGFAPDVIHAHTLGLDSGIGVNLKKRLGCPLVVTTHGSDTEKPLRQGNAERLRKAADMVDHVVAVSDRLGARLKSCGTTTPVSTVLNGFALENMGMPHRKDPWAMIQVGHLIPSKGNETTIRAFARLREKYPKMRLTIIGAGALRQQLEDLTKTLQVADGVRFTGEIPNKAVFAAMAEATYFVMPSKPEGFGIVYLEAMANHCVSVGTEGEGIADLIVSGENGFLVPAEDPQAIVSVLERCLEDSQYTEQIAQKGYESAIGLTWENNAAQYMALFEKLIKER